MLVRCRVAVSEAAAAARMASAAVAQAARAAAAAQRHARLAWERLLAGCPAAPEGAARPLLTAFTFHRDRVEDVRRCGTALSLLLAPVQDVLLVQRMADVSRCALHARGMRHARARCTAGTPPSAYARMPNTTRCSHGGWAPPRTAVATQQARFGAGKIAGSLHVH
jgi:hypothetical protein